MIPFEFRFLHECLARSLAGVAITLLLLLYLPVSGMAREPAASLLDMRSGQTSPVPSRAMTLKRALELARAQNPLLAAARAGIDGSEASLDAAKGGHYPSLTASSRGGYRHTENAEGTDSFWTSRHALALRQPVYAGGGTAAAVNAARERVAGGLARLAQTEQVVALEAVEAFVAVLRDQVILSATLASEQRLAQHVRALAQRYRLGATTAPEVARGEARQAAALAARQTAAGELEASGARFMQRIGQPPGALEHPKPPGNLPGSLQAARKAVDAHPEVVLARAEIEAARHDVGATRSRQRPRLTLEGDAAYADEPENETSGRQDFRLGLNLVVPLYQGGIAGAQIRAANAEMTRRENLLRATRLRVEADIVAAFERHRAAMAALESTAGALAAATIVRDGFEEETSAGQRAIVDLLDAENDLLKAQTAKIEADLAVVENAYRLLAATGRLTDGRPQR